MKQTWLLSLLLLLTAPSMLRAQEADKAAERQFTAYLEAFNDQAEATLRTFLQKNRPGAEDKVEGHVNLRFMSGGLLLKQVQESTPTGFKAILQARNSDTHYFSVVMQVNAAEPHLIRQLSITPVPAPAAFAPVRLTEPQAIRAWKSHLAESAAKDKFSGAALLAKDGKILFEEVYGKADRAKNLTNRTDTKFCLGSLNKMFTAVGIMQLVQVGRISLNAPIANYLPDYPNKEAAARVTVHQLLTHTAGMGDIFGPEYAAHQAELKTLQDYIRIYGGRLPEFETV